VSITMSNGEPASTVIKDADGNPYSPVTDGPVDKFYAVTMNFHCNLEAKDIVIKNFAFNETIFTYVIDMETEHGNLSNIFCSKRKGCPIITLDQVSQFVEDNKIVFTVIGCIIGLLIAFLGLKLFLPTLFAAGFISGFLITLVKKKIPFKFIILVHIFRIRCHYRFQRINQMDPFCICMHFGSLVWFRHS